MTKCLSSLSLAGALLGLTLVSAPAQATATRVWVSGKGSDTNPCTLALPCRTFAYALTQTSPGGEIDVLDPAGYGAVTITQAVSIINDGVGEVGLQAAAGGAAITINAGPNDVIHLRGLTLEGGGTALNGIVFNAGGILEVLNSTVRHFTNNGFNITPGNSSGFLISNTFVSANGNFGIRIAPSGAAVVNGVIHKVTASDNYNDGIRINGASSTGRASVTIVDSVISKNGGNGIYAGSSSSGAAPSVTLRNSVVSYNAYGVYASNYSTFRIAHSGITDNTNYGAYIIAGGNSFINSYSDNNIDGNGTGDVYGTLSSLSPH